MKCCCLIRNQLLSCTVKQPAKNELATENHQLCDGYGFLSEDGIVGHVGAAEPITLDLWPPS
jgi:hypothetical protein